MPFRKDFLSLSVWIDINDSSEHIHVQPGSKCFYICEAMQSSEQYLLRRTVSTQHEVDTVVAAAAAKSLQSCPTLCNPIDSPPGSPVPGFSRQEHWSGLPFPSPMHESEK